MKIVVPNVIQVTVPDMIQIFVLVVLLGTLLAIYFQFKAARKALQVSMLVNRRDLYYTTNLLTEETVKTMMLHVFDHFDMNVYEGHYKGKPDKVRSYLLMKRKYLYLILSEWVEEDKFDPSKDAPNLWLQELCAYREFRDVHASQRHYYPKFAKKVDEIIAKTPCKGWALAKGYDKITI